MIFVLNRNHLFLTRPPAAAGTPAKGGGSMRRIIAGLLSVLMLILFLVIAGALGYDWRDTKVFLVSLFASFLVEIVLFICYFKYILKPDYRKKPDR